MNKTELNKLEKADLVDLVLKGSKEQEELLAVIKDMEATIEELNQSKKDDAAGLKIVEHKKKRYALITPSFKLKATKYGYADLLEDSALVEEILKIEGQNILKEHKS